MGESWYLATSKHSAKLPRTKGNGQLAVASAMVAQIDGKHRKATCDERSHRLVEHRLLGAEFTRVVRRVPVDANDDRAACFGIYTRTVIM